MNRRHHGGHPPHDIIVVGASAGGVQALLKISSALPEDLGAAVFAVVHTGPHSPGAWRS